MRNSDQKIVHEVVLVSTLIDVMCSSELWKDLKMLDIITGNGGMSFQLEAVMETVFSSRSPGLIFYK